MSIFKKALSIFVEMDEETPKNTTTNIPSPSGHATPPPSPNPVAANISAASVKADMGKFVKHFEKLFDDANLPGPDYYEFWKMMDTLEVHIPDENARIQAVFATLSMQGLNKPSLVDSAGKYKSIIESDRANFENAAAQKADAEIAGRQKAIQDLQNETENRRKTIAQLQQEIDASGAKLEQLQQEMANEQAKIDGSKQGYLAACNAMLSKIEQDVQRFKSALT